MIKVQENLYIILSTCIIVHMVHIFETLIAFFYAHPLSLSLPTCSNILFHQNSIDSDFYQNNFLEIKF